MGSYISLGIGRLEIDWAKNWLGRDHGSLFQPEDLGKATYYYAEDERERKAAYVRPLTKLVSRLELLGYTLDACERAFKEVVDLTIRDGSADEGMPFDYKSLAGALAQIDVWSMRVPESDDYDLGEFLRDAILADNQFRNLLPDGARLSRYSYQFLEQLHPYVILRLLAENPVNAGKMVSWRFADVFDGGWIEEVDLRVGSKEHEQFLIVTEGSSDSNLLARSLVATHPEVADFFNFIDMSEDYPFTGAGNIVRFCQGLAKIRIQNQILVVLDNDTAGRDALRRIRAITLPPTLKVVILPDLADDLFETLGPAGRSREAINGRAVSTEMFLDLAYGQEDAPYVRWTGFNEAMADYQGELVGKARYVREYLTRGWKDSSYDMTGLHRLWTYLIDSCVAIQETLPLAS